MFDSDLHNNNKHTVRSCTALLIKDSNLQDRRPHHPDANALIIVVEKHTIRIVLVAPILNG